MRKMKIKNPQHEPLRVGWNLKLDPLTSKHFRTGEIEIILNDRDMERPKRVLAFPCLVDPSGKCVAQKIGYKREYDRETKELETENSFIIVQLPKRLRSDIDRIFLKVEKECTELLKKLKGQLRSLSAIITIPPKERKIPEVVEIQEISLEGLPENALVSYTGDS